jgi:hypothetical protein
MRLVLIKMKVRAAPQPATMAAMMNRRPQPGQRPPQAGVPLPADQSLALVRGIQAQDHRRR